MVLTFCLNEYQIDIPADADNVVWFDVEVDDVVVVHEHDPGHHLIMNTIINTNRNKASLQSLVIPISNKNLVLDMLV